MTLKSSIKTKMDCQECRKGRIGKLVRSNMDCTWMVVKVDNYSKVLSSRIPGEDD